MADVQGGDSNYPVHQKDGGWKRRVTSKELSVGDQLTKQHKAWLDKAKIAHPAGGQGGPAPSSPAVDPATVRGSPEWKANRHAGVKASEDDENARNQSYADKKMRQALQPIKLQDLLSNPAKGNEFTKQLDSYAQSHPDDPVVKQAVADTTHKFAKLFLAVKDLETASIAFVQEVQHDAGRYEAIDARLLDGFNDDMITAAKSFQKASSHIEGGKFGQAWASVTVGVTYLNSAGMNATLLNMHALADAVACEAALRQVISYCKVAIGIIGGAGSALVKLAGVAVGTMIKGAELTSATKLYHTTSELTVGSIAVDTLLDLGALWIGENQAAFFKSQAAAAVKAGIEALPKPLWAKAWELAPNIALSVVKNGLSKVNDRYLGAHGNEKKAPKEMGADVAWEAWKDYGADKFGEVLAEALKH